MHNSRPASRGQIQPIVAAIAGAVALIAIVALLASRPGPEPAPTEGPAAPSLGPSSGPTANPSARPSDPPRPSATPSPTPLPTPSGPPASISLANATDHDVILQIHDQTGKLVGAATGAPGDGMSVRWHATAVGQLDDRTISVTWVGLPGDEVLDLGVAIEDGRLLVTIVQAGPVANSDAMGEDRIVVLSFAEPVSADDIATQVLDRTID
jgi:hypothetical protein